MKISDKKSQELYYIPPSIEAFNEMKETCIDIWNTYDDEYGYRTEKVNAIKDIENVGDNFMFMFAMFDIHNQIKVVRSVSSETRKEILSRLPTDYLFYLLA